MTLSEVKVINQVGGFYFFSPDTMRFFGDTMSSFKVSNRQDGVYVVRVKAPTKCPDRQVGQKMIGSTWKLDPVTGNLKSCEAV